MLFQGGKLLNQSINQCLGLRASVLHYLKCLYFYMQPRPAATGLEQTWPPAQQSVDRLAPAATSLAPEAPVCADQVCAVKFGGLVLYRSFKAV